MILDPKDTICGVPAEEARAMLREVHDHLIYHDQDFLQRLRPFIEAGYVEYRDEGREGSYSYYKLHPTISGAAVAMGKFGKPITRKTAERLVAELVERAKAINASEDYWYRVTRLRVFGSYLDPAKDRLGDVDVALDYEPRWPVDQGAGWTRDLHDALDAYHEKFGAPSDRQAHVKYLGLPEKHFRAVLRGRSIALSIHTEDPTAFTDRVETIFEAEPAATDG